MICSVCDKHGIPYYLAAGSLLGAVRHGGFIPWDDDIDIEFLRHDYFRIIELLRSELGSQLVIQDYKSDKSCPFPFSKVFLRNEVTRELHYPQLNRSGYAFVDIFPLGKCPGNRTLARLFFKEVELFTVAAKSKVVPEEQCGYSKWYARALFRLVRAFPIPVLQSWCRGAISFFNSISSGKYVCYPGGKYGYPYEMYKADWYRTRELKQFEDERFYVPGAWDDLLKYKYGDYMQPPAENDRKGHFQDS